MQVDVDVNIHFASRRSIVGYSSSVAVELEVSGGGQNEVSILQKDKVCDYFTNGNISQVVSWIQGL